MSRDTHIDRTFPLESREPPLTTGNDPPLELAARHARYCRQDLKLIYALLNSPEGHPRQAKRVAARLNRHLRHLEFALAELKSETPAAPPPAAPPAPAPPEPTFDSTFAAERAFRLKFEPASCNSPLASDSFTHTRGIWLSLSAIAAIIAAFFMFRAALLYQPGPDETHANGSHPDASAADPAVWPPDSPAKAQAPDFSGSVDRLNDALGQFPNQNPRDVLMRVRKENAARGIDVCSFEWNEGEPSLVYGSRRGHVALDAVMGNCAQAVERAAHPAPPAGSSASP